MALIMAGYSKTPLWKKLGLKSGMRVMAIDVPPDYAELLRPLPEGVTFVEEIGRDVDLVHLFTKSRSRLTQRLNEYRSGLRSDAVVWISWPKKSSNVKSDVTEDVIREVALPLGFVDVKVCAVDAIWSGLKLVVRLENRGRPSRSAARR